MNLLHLSAPANPSSLAKRDARGLREGKVRMEQMNLPHPSTCEPEQSREA